MVDAKGRKLAAPTISGNFDGVLTAHLEDGSERKLWEKQYPPSGPGRQGTWPISVCFGLREPQGCAHALMPSKGYTLPVRGYVYIPHDRLLKSHSESHEGSACLQAICRPHTLALIC